MKNTYFLLDQLSSEQFFSMYMYIYIYVPLEAEKRNTAPTNILDPESKNLVIFATSIPA